MEGRDGSEARAASELSLTCKILGFLSNDSILRAGLAAGSSLHPCPGGFGQEGQEKGRVLPKLRQFGAGGVFSGVISPLSLLWHPLSA